MKDGETINFDVRPELPMNLSNEVTIEFPNNIDGLVKVLNWLYNSGDFMTFNMSEELIEKGHKAGIKITKKENMNYNDS